MITFLIIYLIGFIISLTILLSSIPDIPPEPDSGVLTKMVIASLGSWITLVWIIWVLLND